jgi:hypothetical protein
MQRFGMKWHLVRQHPVQNCPVCITNGQPYPPKVVENPSKDQKFATTSKKQERKSQPQQTDPPSRS